MSRNAENEVDDLGTAFFFAPLKIAHIQVVLDFPEVLLALSCKTLVRIVVYCKTVLSSRVGEGGG